MKVIKIILIFIMITVVQTDVFADVYNEEYSIVNNDSEWKLFKEDWGLPLGTPTMIRLNGNGYYVNKELIQEKGILVYGDFRDISRNDFKTIDDGYYNKRNRTGEYRYHGYTLEGGKHGNDDFPRDASSSTLLANKNWLYKPWDRDSFGFASFNKNSGSIGEFNRFVLRWDGKTDSITDPAEKQKITEMIASSKAIVQNSMAFEIVDATYNGTDKITKNIDPIYFANVQTTPTSRLSGQSIMFHKSVWDGKPWYQTFSMSKIEEKNDSPFETSITETKVRGITEFGLIDMIVKVEGYLIDEEIIDGDEVTKATYYHRDDVLSWEMELNTPSMNTTISKDGSPIEFNGGNKAYQWFQLNLEYEDYKMLLSSDFDFDLLLEASAQANFNKGHYLKDTDTKQLNINGGEYSTTTPKINEEINFEIEAPTEILDVWSFPLVLSEIKVPMAYNRSVTIDGELLSEEEETKFVEGLYQFQVIRESRVYNYTITYSNGEDEYTYASYVLVYDSVPYASVMVTDYGKVNRKNTITADYDLMPVFVKAHTDVSVSRFDIVSRDNQSIYYGLNSLQLKEYLIKEIGTVDVYVTVSNEYGSRSYIHEIFSGEDYKPDLISIIWNNNLIRKDSLDIFSEGASTDGDIVGSVYYEIFYDENSDGVAEQSVYPQSEFLGFTDFKPDKLGYYEIEFTITEAFGEETLEQYINIEDYMVTTHRREFIVDNLIPMTKVFSDIEYNFPVLDVTFLVDQDYPKSEMDYLRENNVEVRNNFRMNSMVTNLKIWDLHTYVYSQTAYSRTAYGSSYPPTSVGYNSGGYSGTLSRYDVDNYPYSRDYGKFENKTSSKTVTTTRSQSNDVIYPKYTDADRTPSSVSYNSGGYVGRMYKRSGYAYYNHYLIKRNGVTIGYHYSMAKNYSGTATKSERVWVPNIRTYNSYYGDYSGTVYKRVKQSFTPVYINESNKYLVYFTKSRIQNHSDLEKIKNLAPDVELILIGDSSLKDTIDEDLFISYSSDTLSVINSIVSSIKERNPRWNELSLLVNEEFTLSHTDSDEENDPIVERGYQYIHDASYFDNSLGQEMGTYVTYDASQYTSEEKLSFTKPGRYEIIRRVKDEPVEDPSQGRYSNLSTMDVVVHRKPIANDAIDWTYDSNKGMYRVNYIDTSYDPDYQFSRADRGIINRKIKIRKIGGEWIYGVPEFLSAGNYEKELIVQDVHGVWSDPFVSSMSLSNLPSPQLLSADIKTVDNTFSTDSIPSTEWLVIYNILTRFPYDEYLKVEWLQGNEVLFDKTIINEYDIQDTEKAWHDIHLEIPKSFADGHYQLKLSAVDANNLSNQASKVFDVIVYTPIDLIGSVTEELSLGVNSITAKTSQYCDAVNVMLFKGSEYESLRSMTRINATDWSLTFDSPEDIESGDYRIEFIGTVLSAPPKNEVFEVSTNIITLAASSIEIIGDWSYWDRDRNIFGDVLSRNSHRFLSLENISILVTSIGEPTEINIDFSPEMKSVIFEDSLGNHYNNKELTGSDFEFPLLMGTVDHTYWSKDFILPLVDSTLDYDDNRKRSAYYIRIELKKGTYTKTYIIDDIEITGNTMDHIFLQPNN